MNEELLLDETDIQSLRDQRDLEAAYTAADPDPQSFNYIPFALSASGLYYSSNKLLKLPRNSRFLIEESDEFEAQTGYMPDAPSSFFFKSELRLDIDGRYPQMQASGSFRTSLFIKVDWIARLKRLAGSNLFLGDIWYKNGPINAMRYTKVLMKIKYSWFPHQRQLIALFFGGGMPPKVQLYNFSSAYFSPAEFEFDRVSDVDANKAVTAIDTCEHPNRPAGLPCENLSLEKVYRRAGFNVRKSSGDSVVPIASAMANGTWSNAEMHDAMQVYWSQFANQSQWSLWVLFARLHDWGTGLGGIMFDDIGPNHRQGTAIFTDAFISQAPAGDPDPDAWVKRMRFWTAAHEMGHAFNLAHSWQKSLGAPYGTPWLPGLTDEPEARSFMNYPYGVSGGETSFFSDFEYRFSDGELLFLRHAPRDFVQMGNADWFDNHGFEQASPEQSTRYRLQLRTNRVSNLFEFLESVSVELKLTNISGQTQTIAANILADYQNIVLVIKRQGSPARQWLPFAHYLQEQKSISIDQGSSLYDSLMLSAGGNGWDIAEPGRYILQAMIMIDGELISSNPLQIRVATPQSQQEEVCAQDLFTQEAGQVLAFGGSCYLETANNVLREVDAQLPQTAAAQQARLTLALPNLKTFKYLNISKPAKNLAEAIANKTAKIDGHKADEGARKILNDVLIQNGDRAADTLGHIAYKRCTDMLASTLADYDDISAAREIQKSSRRILQARSVPDWVFAKEEALDTRSAKGNKKTTEKET